MLNTVLFFTDSECMEIIHCLEASGFRKSRSRSRFAALSAGIRTVPAASAKTAYRQKTPLYLSFSSGAAAAKNAFTVLSLLQNVRCQAGVLGKKIRRASRFAWIVPAAFLCASVPFAVSRLVSYSESFARIVNLNPDEMHEFERIDSAMNQFAFDRISYFDSEGNIFSEDGLQVTADSQLIKQPVTFNQYTVKPGDTISGISRKFGLSNISTLIAVNSIGNVRSVFAGQKLSVPSVDGLFHSVSKNETLASISKKYGAAVSDLLDVNDLSSEILKEGQSLFIPGAKLEPSVLRKAMGELFVNPLHARYRLTSRFGYRKDPFTGVDSSHTGIDMACPTGTAIYASMSGKVVYTGFSSVYGNYVIINHYDGYQTLYGHMSKIISRKGDYVTQDTKIGLVGNTGYSTGPHLHFTVFKNSKLVDPLTVLK